MDNYDTQIFGLVMVFMAFGFVFGVLFCSMVEVRKKMLDEEKEDDRKSLLNDIENIVEEKVEEIINNNRNV